MSDQEELGVYGDQIDFDVLGRRAVVAEKRAFKDFLLPTAFGVGVNIAMLLGNNEHVGPLAQQVEQGLQYLTVLTLALPFIHYFSFIRINNVAEKHGGSLDGSRIEWERNQAVVDLFVLVIAAGVSVSLLTLPNDPTVVTNSMGALAGGVAAVAGARLYSVTSE